MSRLRLKKGGFYREVKAPKGYRIRMGNSYVERGGRKAHIFVAPKKTKKSYSFPPSPTK